MDQTGTPVTIEQLIKISVNQLSAISVPASLTEQIAIPIYRVINNLKIGLEAIAAAESEKTAPPSTQEEEPEIEAVEENQNGSDEHNED